MALGLAAAQRSLGGQAAIWSTDGEQELADLAQERGLPDDLVRRFAVVGPARLAYSPDAERAALSADGAQYAVLHLHSLWTACSHLSLRWREKYQRPTIIAPHGSLKPWAMRRSVLRKRLSLWAYEAKNFRTAACFHALSESEVPDFRDFGLRNPIAIIPNGIAEDWLASTGDGERFRAACAIPADKRLLLFLSRITPVKGLPLLLRAMAASRAALRDWLLILAGPNEFGHQQELEDLVGELSLSNLVRFVGPLYGQQKRDVFAAAELFVLPSLSEAAPMAALESLGTGTPVLTTEAVSLPELTREACGWRTAIADTAIAEALCAAIALSPEELQVMGQRGKAIVGQCYTWRQAAARSLACYRWLLGEGERPDFVLT